MSNQIVSLELLNRYSSMNGRLAPAGPMSPGQPVLLNCHHPSWGWQLNGGMFRMPLQIGFYHSHSQAELFHSGLQPEPPEHINAQDILRNGRHIDHKFTGGQLPNTQGKPLCLHLYTQPLQPSIDATRPGNLSGLPYRRVHSGPVYTGARTHWTFVGDPWIANSTCSLWSPPARHRPGPRPFPYSNVQPISFPSFQEVGTAKWSSSQTGQASQVASPVFPFISFFFWGRRKHWLACNCFHSSNK